jgi:hypothetical protein
VRVIRGQPTFDQYRESLQSALRYAKGEKPCHFLPFLHLPLICHQCISKESNEVICLEITDNPLVELTPFESAPTWPFLSAR